MQNRLEILDIWVDPVNRYQAIDRVRQFLNGKKACSIFAANPEKNFSVPKDPALYSAFKNADLLIPDGIGGDSEDRIYIRRSHLQRVG